MKSVLYYGRFYSRFLQKPFQVVLVVNADDAYVSDYTVIDVFLKDSPYLYRLFVWLQLRAEVVD